METTWIREGSFINMEKGGMKMFGGGTEILGVWIRGG